MPAAHRFIQLSDMFQEMGLVCKTQEVHLLDATALTALDWSCTTISTTNLTPCYNQDLLVYGVSGADVDTVIIDGRLVMEDKKILSFDVQETMMEVRKRETKLNRLFMHHPAPSG